MATRDLTAIFLKCRQDARSNITRKDSFSDSSDNQKSDLLSAGGAAVSWEDARHSLPPMWVDIVDEVEADVRSIMGKMDSLNKLHGNRLKVRFDDSEQAEDMEIETLTGDITHLFRHAEGRLKALAKTAAGQSGAETTVRNNIQRNLARRLQNLSQKFRNNQKDFLARLRSQKKGNSALDFLSSGESKGGVDSGFTDEQMMAVEQQESLAEERDGEIMKIAQSIEELAVIFKELAVLVIDQGTVLDRIDYNMEMVVERTGDGIKQLEKAEEHQKSARAIKCIVAQLLVILILVIIIISKNA